MTTLEWKQVGKIEEFQILTDSSGFILDDRGILFRFSGNMAIPIETPSEIEITDFHFITEDKGAVIGHSRSKQDEASLGNLNMIFPVLFLVLALALTGRVARWYSRRPKNLCLVLVWLCGLSFPGLILSCSRDWEKYKAPSPGSEYTTLIKRFPLSTGIHHFGGNAGQGSFISLTENGGDDWKTFEIGSNFNLTGLIAIGQNFFVSNYAREDHPDGDIWIFGNDTAYSKRLAQNSNENPYHFSAGRGLTGLRFYENDSTLIAFGTEKIFKFPNNENSSTDGNIIELKADLMPDYKITDVPGEVVVRSLARTKSGKLLVTLDDHQLLKMEEGRWADMEIAGHRGFDQVTFIPETGKGYVITTAGEVFKSVDEGESWEPAGLSGIRKMMVWDTTVVFAEGNRLLF